jgi:hypothetical protein
MRGRAAGNSDEFIREVDEAVRQDRWLRLWRQYGTYFVGAALAIVIGTGAGVAWRQWQASQRVEEARRFAAAETLLRQDKPGEAAQAFRAIAGDADSGYGMLARLRAAEAEAQADQPDEAQASLEALAGSDDAAPVYRELGDLLTLQRAFDDLAPDGLHDRLDELSAAGAPWRYSALELQALAQLRAGDSEGARRTLDQLLADPQTPANLSRRAAELMAALGGPPKTAQETAPDAAAAPAADADGAAAIVPGNGAAPAPDSGAEAAQESDEAAQ